MTSLANPRSRSPMLGRTGLAAGLLVAFAAAMLLMPACGETVHSAVPLDCSGEGSYDVIERYVFTPPPAPPASPGTWYQFGDMTPGAVDTNGIAVADGGIPWTKAIEGGGRCGSQASLVLQASGYHDYGDDFVDPDPGNTGQYSSGVLPACPTVANKTCPYDASAYQGIAFWARSPGATTKGVTLLLTDGQSNDFGTILTDCILASYDAGNAVTVTITSPTNPGGSTTTSTGVAIPPVPPGTCGNYFSYALLTTDDWQLYKIPFSAFYQSATTPNRAPDGFDPSTFVSFAVRVPKEAQLQLWLDELGFYPKKGADGGP